MDHLTLIAAETSRFAAVITTTDPEARVPTCPDWNADELLAHYAGVHDFWSRILASGARTDDDAEAIEASATAPKGRAEALVLLESSTSALLSELARREDAEPAWTWFPTNQTVGFTRRMQLHEAVMHRVDAELTAGLDITAIPAEVAADGVAHAIEVMWAWWGELPGFTFTPVGDVVALQAPDLARTWLLQSGRRRGTGESGKVYDSPAVIFVTEGEPVASWVGTAQELDLWLWGRGPEPRAEGDLGALLPAREARDQGMP